MLEKPCKECGKDRNKKGYGRVNRHGTRHFAHRLAYCDHYGVPINDIKGLVVRHMCDNPPCIEPTHLLLGTTADNNRDMVERRRNFRKLNEELVAEIRQKYEWRTVTQAQLAKEYGVTQGRIHQIVNNNQWKHVDPTVKPKNKVSKPHRAPHLFPNPQNGSRSPNARTNEQDVVLIRKWRAEGSKVEVLAALFNVSITTISQICTRKIWAHVP